MEGHPLHAEHSHGRYCHFELLPEQHQPLRPSLEMTRSGQSTPIHGQWVTSMPSNLTCLCEYDGCSRMAYVPLQ